MVDDDGDGAERERAVGGQAVDGQGGNGHRTRVAEDWQIVDGVCLFRHSWQRIDEGRVSAMSILIVILALATVAAILNGTRRTPDDLPDAPWAEQRLWSRYPRV